MVLEFGVSGLVDGSDVAEQAESMDVVAEIHQGARRPFSLKHISNPGCSPDFY